MNPSLRFFSVVAVISFLITGCNGSDSDDKFEVLQQRLDENRERWEQEGISDYTFTVRKICFCVPMDNIVVNVVNDEPVAMYFAESGDYLNDQERSHQEIVSISSLFAAIQEAIEQNAADIQVQFDETYGYPTNVYIDREEMIADEEVGYMVTYFSEGVVPPDQRPDPNLNSIQKSLIENITRWNQTTIDDYQFTLRRVCFCLPKEDVVVNVVGGALESMYFTPSGVYLEEAELASRRVRSVESLFEIIQEAIDDSASLVSVEFDETNGYPIYMSIDPVRLIADDEVIYRITDFQ